MTCRRCDTRLPIRLTKPGENAALWECAECGTRLAGVFLLKSTPDRHARIRLATIHFDLSQAPAIPESYDAIVERLVARHGRGRDKNRPDPARSLHRLEVAVATLDGSLSPLRCALRALVHTVTESSVGLVTATPVTSSHVAIQFDDPTMGCAQVVGQVTHSQPVSGEISDVGVDFIFRFGGKLDDLQKPSTA